MFEQSLVSLETRKKSRRGWLSLPAAILIHLVALTTFVLAGYWHIDEVPEPLVQEIFFVTMPPPPPPLGSGRPETKPEVKLVDVKPVVPEQTVQPPVDPEPQAPTSPVVDIVADLPANGDPRGSEHGKEGGDPDLGVEHSDCVGCTGGPLVVVGNTEPQPVNDVPIVVGGAVKKPEILVKTQPRYTELARKAGIQGVVILKAVIDERGYVTNLEIERGQPMGLDQAAVEAVRSWRFKPATLHGRPVKVYYYLTVNFQLQR
jgi:periplasmic protein TonB